MLCYSPHFFRQVSSSLSWLDWLASELPAAIILHRPSTRLLVGLQEPTATAGIVEIRTHILVLIQRVLYLLNHLPSSPFLFRQANLKQFISASRTSIYPALVNLASPTYCPSLTSFHWLPLLLSCRMFIIYTKSSGETM